eukprot:1008095-Prorocentrum_lima.AAC.1
MGWQRLSSKPCCDPMPLKGWHGGPAASKICCARDFWKSLNMCCDVMVVASQAVLRWGKCE